MKHDDAIAAALANRSFVYTYLWRAFAAEPDEAFLSAVADDATLEECKLLAGEDSRAVQVQEALAAYRQTKPELALLDVMLPDGDGFTLCQYLRAFEPDTPLPVIFLTAKDETDDRLAGLRCGADDYVTKPFSPQELILRMQAVPVSYTHLTLPTILLV